VQFEGAKIFIIEDNDDIRFGLRLALEVKGYSCDEALDGMNALEFLSRSPAPDLILLDMLMPKMNGWDFVTQVKKDPNHPLAKIPIIAVTATTEKVERIPVEIDAVIRKPVDLPELYSTIERVRIKKPSLSGAEV
jgi:CheY-like chemotaxis protein